MTTIIPKPKAQQVIFFDNHAQVFVDNAAVLGVLPAKATAFKAAAGIAHSKWKAQSDAAIAAKSATAESNDALADARAQCAEIIATIKAFAGNNANPQAIYTLAQIPAPAAPSPAPAPGKPVDFTCRLMPTGELLLSWTCENPAGTTGTVYEVKRKIGTGALTYIGLTGEKKFIDDSVPSSAAVPGLTYYITAVRSTQRGVTATFGVNFGMGGDGLAFTTVSDSSSAKLAA